MTTRIYLDSLEGDTTVGYVKARIDEICLFDGVTDSTKLTRTYDPSFLRDRWCFEGPDKVSDLGVDDLARLARSSKDSAERTAAFEEIVERARVAEVATP